MPNINFCGETAVQMGSKGKLTTSDTCMTPPYCIPITYTNLAESQVADQTVSSVKICGNPACNQDSIFKISQGDGPGCCGGVSSGSVGQMTKFIEGLSNVSLAGVAAVCNGLLKSSNAQNTDQQPLIQPPAGNPPANTAEAPEAMTGDYSQQFDFMNYLGSAPGEKTVIERPAYEIWTTGGVLLNAGQLSAQGLTQRVTTPEKTDLVVWLGDGEWRFYKERDHGQYDSDAEAPTTATIGFVFFNFAMAYLPELEYKLVAGDQTVTGKTGINGVAQTIKDLQPGTQVEVWVQKEQTKEFKKIGIAEAHAGETYYQVVSSKIKAEGATEKHQNQVAATPKAKPAQPTTKSEKKKAPPQKAKTEATRNADNHPLAKLEPSKDLWLAAHPVLAVFMYASWGMLKIASRLVAGNENLNPASSASQAGEGTPLSKADLAKLQELVKFAEKQVNFDYRGCVDDNGARSTKQVLAKYEHTLIGDPSFEYEVHGDEKIKSNKPTVPTGWCLWYVKIALMKTNYVNCRLDAGAAKESVNDWNNEASGYKEVKDLPPVLVTYEHAYAEKDAPKVEKALGKEAKVKELNAQLKKLYTKLDAATKAKDTKKTEAIQKEIDTKNSELETAKKDADKANEDKPAKSKAQYTQPDLMYTLPGDLIVYEQVDPVEYHAAGHIDIRTYHGFCSDFEWALTPALGKPPSKYKRYKVIGVFRKISDSMAMVRVRAFLRILRELETAGYEEKDSYFALPDAKDPTTGKVVRRSFTKTDTHPFGDDAPIKYDTKDYSGHKNTAAGAYQIKKETWEETLKATGWPPSFQKEMQDRIAIYRLQARPLESVSHPRRSALGYIMESKIEEAINETGLANEWSCLPGGKGEKISIGEIQKKFDEYVGRGA